MLERIFLQIIGMSRAAGIIIVIVCIVRMYECVLWYICVCKACGVCVYM